MKLPNAELAVVERGKIVDYLLAPSHPDNGGKAEFFFSPRFPRGRLDVTGGGSTRAAEEADVSTETTTAHGRKFVTVGRIETPSGRRAAVQAIWIVDTGSEAARLVTAYPVNE